MYLSGLLYYPHPGKDHWKCSDQRCVTAQIDEPSYRTLHDTEARTCSNLGPNTEDLCKVVEGQAESSISTGSNGIAMISRAAGGSSLALETVRWQPGRPYMAFSHVWADGLRNTQENTLPGCEKEPEDILEKLRVGGTWIESGQTRCIG